MQGLPRPTIAGISRLVARAALAVLAAAAALAVDAQAPTPAKPAAKPTATAPVHRAESKPTWSELTPSQQHALKPLATAWSGMSESHKRKWLALSRNFGAMPPADQEKLHSRMTEWAALSPQQRTQARLNFAEAKSVPLDERKAKWEAYQALSPEEKRKLAARAPAKTPPTAAAVHPGPSQKLATVPRRSGEVKAPRIAAGPAPSQIATPVPPAVNPPAATAVQPTVVPPVQPPVAAPVQAPVTAPIQPVTQEN